MDDKTKLQLGLRGYAIQPLPNVRSYPKRIFYNKVGAPLELLGDPVNVQTYLRKGFTTEPNGQVQEIKKE
jgi:hypothetical protein